MNDSTVDSHCLIKCLLHELVPPLSYFLLVLCYLAPRNLKRSLNVFWCQVLGLGLGLEGHVLRLGLEAQVLVNNTVYLSFLTTTICLLMTLKCMITVQSPPTFLPPLIISQPTSKISLCLMPPIVFSWTPTSLSLFVWLSFYSVKNTRAVPHSNHMQLYYQMLQHSSRVDSELQMKVHVSSIRSPAVAYTISDGCFSSVISSVKNWWRNLSHL